MELSYNITREAAAQYLGVSTRTIDRYVKSGKLSYKKVANKVILAKEEVDAIKDDFSLLRQDAEYTEVISSSTNSLAKPASSSSSRGNDSGINERLDQFFGLITEKDKALEDKNKVIFVLQQKLGELEGRMKSMIALPEHTEEKQKLLIEKERLESKLKEVYTGYKGERTKNIVWMSIMFIVILAVIIFIFMRG
ncbi:helix-turn-helix domain-containing protein [Patescibacteria group bacterium]|nr:helix-turn-helix domain-containing protein [Patescibacteria group bacterium]